MSKNLDLFPREPGRDGADLCVRELPGPWLENIEGVRGEASCLQGDWCSVVQTRGDEANTRKCQGWREGREGERAEGWKRELVSCRGEGAERMLPPVSG